MENNLGQLERTMEMVSMVRKSSSRNMKLGELIKQLSIRPQEQTVRFDFYGFAPCGIRSYRGYYEDLAIGFDDTREITVAALLTQCRTALGSVQMGYKGGEFRMDEDTLLWVGNYGECRDTAVVGVTGSDYETVIETQWMPS